MNTPFTQSYQDVIDTLNRMDHSIDEEAIIEIACRLAFVRRADGGMYGCLHHGGSGVHTWIKSRLREMNLLPKCGGQCDESEHVSGVFHFYPWDTERYGDFFAPAELKIETFKSGTQRSPLSRIGDASPVNTVARKIIQNHDHHCPFCTRYFRNPAALALHVQDVHGEEHEPV